MEVFLSLLSHLVGQHTPVFLPPLITIANTNKGEKSQTVY